VVVIDDYEDVPENDEASLLKAVSKQPVSIAIEASGRDFQHYMGVSPNSNIPSPSYCHNYFPSKGWWKSICSFIAVAISKFSVTID
jgi:hypothetical protein